jgi:hypothetical protein
MDVPAQDHGGESEQVSHSPLVLVKHLTQEYCRVILQSLKESQHLVAYAQAQHAVVLNSKNGMAKIKAATPEKPLLT